MPRIMGGHPVAALLILTCIAISGRAETISSNGQQSSQNANTIRSNPQGAPAKVVRPPPPPPQPLVIVPVNPPNQRPSHSRH
jgi:hypothetical protein